MMKTFTKMMAGVLAISALLTSVVTAQEKANLLPNLSFAEKKADAACGRGVVTTESLPRAKVSDAPYDKPDGTSYRLDTDYFGKKRNTENPAPGPFQFPSMKGIRLKVWPKKQPKDETQNN